MSEVKDLSLADFSGLLDETIEVTLQDQTVPMRLVAAEALAGSPRQSGGFRLEFLGPAVPVLEQGIMTVSGKNGTHDIFMVPIAADAAGVRYEAVFY